MLVKINNRAICMKKEHKTKLFLVFLAAYFVLLIFSAYQQENFVLDEGAHAIDSMFFEKYFTHFTTDIKGFTNRFYAFYGALFLNEYPPLVDVLVGALYTVFGAGIFLSRILISAFSIAALYLLYIVGRKTYNEDVGMYAAVFLSAVPYFLKFSSILMMEIPVIFFLLLCSYFLIEKKPFALGLALGLSFYVKYTSVLFAPVILIYFLLNGRLKQNITFMAKLFSVSAAMIIPYMLALQAFTGKLYTADLLSGQIGPTLEWWGIPKIVPGFAVQYFYYPNILLFVIPVAIIPIFLLYFRRIEKKDSLFLIWLAVFAITYALIANKTPKYVIYILPPIAVLAAKTFSGFKPFVRNALLIAVFALLAYSIFFAQVFSGSPWDENRGGVEIGEYLKQNLPENASALVYGPYYSVIYGFAKDDNFNNPIARLRDCQLNISREQFYNMTAANGVYFAVISDYDRNKLDESYLENFTLEREYKSFRVFKNKNPVFGKMRACNYNCYLNKYFCTG